MAGFIIMLVFFGMAGFVLYLAAGNLRRAWMVWSTPTTPCGEVTPGQRVEVHGEISALSGKVISPMTRTECVYFKFEVKEKVKRGKNSTWVSRVNDVDHGMVLVEDDSGAVEIELAGAETHLSTDHTQSSGFLNDATPELEALLTEYGMSSSGTVFNRTLRYKETILEVGDPLYVLGSASDGGGQGFPLVMADHTGWMLVSDSSEGRFLSGLAFWGGIELVGALAIAGFGLFLLGL